MRSLALPLALLLAAGLFASACITIERAARAYPDPPDGATAVVYVAPDGDDTADGSWGAPFATIQAGIDAAPDGAAVLVADGDYPEEIAIGRSIAVVGGEGVSVGLNGLSIILHVVGPDTAATLHGLHFWGAVTASALVKEAYVELHGCTIEGGTAEVSLNEGLGLVAAEGAMVVLNDTMIHGHAGTGVIAYEADLHVFASTIAANATGGIMAQDAPGELVVDQSTLTENDVFGVAAMGTDLVVARTTIEKSLSFGDGIVSAPSAIAGAGDALIGGPDACTALGESADTDCGNVIVDNQRFGVLFDHGHGAVSGNTIDGNGSGGIWLQHGDGTTDIGANVISNNGMVGVAVAGGAYANVHGNEVETTRSILYQLGAEDFGDGVAVLQDGAADVAGNTISGSERAGVFLSWVGIDTVVGENTFFDNASDVVCQGANSCGVQVPQSDSEPGTDDPGGPTDEGWHEDDSAEAPSSSFGIDAAGAAGSNAGEFVDEDEDDDDGDGY